MPIKFTYEYPLIVHTNSATAPTYEINGLTARNCLERARLTPEIQDIPADLYEAAECLIRGQLVPPQIQTKLFSLNSKQSQMTYEDALLQLALPEKGSNSLVGITTTYERYKGINEVKLIKSLAENQLLTKAVAKEFDIRELKQAGVDFSQLFTEEELKKLNIENDESNAALYRLADGQYQIHTEIPVELKGESIYVMGVEKQGIEENMLVEVVEGKEFDEYEFEADEGDEFTVYLKIIRGKGLPAESRSSWVKSEDECMQELQAQLKVVDCTYSRDGNCGVLSANNYLDNGLSTLSKEVSAEFSIYEDIWEVKGWEQLLESLKNQSMNLHINGACFHLFEPFVKEWQNKCIELLNDNQKYSFEDIMINYENINLMQLIEGSFAYKLELPEITKYLFNSLSLGEFNSLDFIQDLYAMYNSINHLLTRRIVALTKKTYFKKPNNNHINVSYSKWAGCESYHNFINSNNGNEELIDDKIIFQFLNDESTENEKKQNVENFLSKYKNSERSKEIIDSTDHLIGQYLYQQIAENDGATNSKSNEEAANGEKALESNKNKEQRSKLATSYYQDYYEPDDLVYRIIEIPVLQNSEQFDYKLDSQNTFLDYEPFNDYYNSIEEYEEITIIEPQKKFMEAAPISAYLPDFVLLFIRTEFELELQRYGYRFQEQESLSEENTEILEIPKSYSSQMLELENGKPLDYGDNMEVIIPDEFMEMLNLTKFSDFREISVDMLEKLGFTLPELAVFVDVAENCSSISPFLMYDQEIGYFYVPAFFNKSEKLLSIGLKYHPEAISQILTAAIQQPLPVLQTDEVNYSNIMTLIDISEVYRKLGQAIRDYKQSNFSCFEFMGKKLQTHLESKQYLDIIKSNLVCEDGIIEFFAPTSAERQQISNEISQENKLEELTYEEIVQQKPVFVEDFEDEHESCYEFACEKLDELEGILKGVTFNFNVYYDESAEYFDYYTGKGTKELEKQLFSYEELEYTQQLSLEELMEKAFLIRPISQYSARDIILLSRIRGYEINFLLKSRLISPDDPKVNIQKFYGFTSVSDIMQNFGEELQNKPLSLAKLTKQPFSAPLFYRLTALEMTAQLPLKDVFGRVLRAQSPYSFNLVSTVNEGPAPLESEAPAPPTASGEESASEVIISFWQKFLTQHYCIDQNTIEALLSPLFCLEQRVVEQLKITGPSATSCNEADQLLNQTKDNSIVACRCTTSAFILYSPNSTELDSFMRGIYYMSPYFIPLCGESLQDKSSCLAQACSYAVSVICQLLRDTIDRYVNLPIIAPQTRPPPVQFTDVVLGYFRAEIAPDSFSHIKCSIPVNSFLAPRKFFPHTNTRDLDFRNINSCEFLLLMNNKQRSFANDKFQLAEYIKNSGFWGPEVTFKEKIEQLAPLIDLVVEKHPILNILLYGDVRDDVNVLEVRQFLSLGKLGRCEEEQRKIEANLLQKKKVTDEILIELEKMQGDLQKCELQNIQQLNRVSHQLQNQRYQDMHDDICDVYATLVNATYAKACGMDKKIHPQTKISVDMQLYAGFETGGPDVTKITDWGNKELKELAERNCLSFGREEWPEDGFDIRQIVNFD